MCAMVFSLLHEWGRAGCFLGERMRDQGRCQMVTMGSPIQGSGGWGNRLPRALPLGYYETPTSGLKRQQDDKQEEHHRGYSFQEEYREILKKNGIEIDEKYLWD